jgi:hypothetical protein
VSTVHKAPTLAFILTLPAGSDPSNEGPSKFINFQTFAALVHSSGMLRTPPHLITYNLEQAFGQEKSFFGKAKPPKDLPAVERDAWIQAAAQWMLHQGGEMYAQVTEGQLKSKQWTHWHESFEAVAAGKTEKQARAYSEETMQLAGRAAVAMAALEKVLTVILFLYLNTHSGSQRAVCVRITARERGLLSIGCNAIVGILMQYTRNACPAFASLRRSNQSVLDSAGLALRKCNTICDRHQHPTYPKSNITTMP